MRHALTLPAAALAALALAACGGVPTPQLSSADSMREALRIIDMDYERYPQYSVILEDMRADGRPEHQYRVVYSDTAGGDLALRETRTPWVEVKPDEFQRHMENLGMAVYAKNADGTRDTTAVPAGFHYVGDERYGQWQQGSNGSFWVWYGQYALMRNLLDGDIFDRDYRDYRRHRARYGSRPYYGRSQQWGSSGTYTARSRPDFMARRASIQQASRSGFESKVQQRTGRSNMSGVRSRSGGSGGK